MKNNREHFITVDELAKKYLKPEVAQSFPDLNIQIKKVGIKIGVRGITIKGFVISAEADQISITVFLVSLVTTLLIWFSR